MLYLHINYNLWQYNMALWSSPDVTAERERGSIPNNCISKKL